jgi:hypothetical protein
MRRSGVRFSSRALRQNTRSAAMCSATRQPGSPSDSDAIARPSRGAGPCSLGLDAGGPAPIVSAHGRSRFSGPRSINVSSSRRCAAGQSKWRRHFRRTARLFRALPQKELPTPGSQDEARSAHRPLPTRTHHGEARIHSRYGDREPRPIFIRINDLSLAGRNQLASDVPHGRLSLANPTSRRPSRRATHGPHSWAGGGVPSDRSGRMQYEVAAGDHTEPHGLQGSGSRVHRAVGSGQDRSHPLAPQLDRAVWSGAVPRHPTDQTSGGRGREFTPPPPDSTPGASSVPSVARPRLTCCGWCKNLAAVEDGDS